MDKIWIGFFLQWHVNVYGLFNAKVIIVKEQKLYYLTHRWEDKGVHTFPKDINSKVNRIV